MKFNIEYDIENDVRWIAEIPSIPGALAYGDSQKDAASKVIAIALNVIAENIELNTYPNLLEISYSTL